MAKNDDTIKALMTKVAEQKSTLGYKPAVSWKTNALFKYDNNTHFNLNATRDSAVLVEALAFILQKRNLRVEASKMLEVPTPSFTWDGYSVEDWVADFKTRISILAWEAKQAHLTSTQAKLSQLVSEEARTEMELEALAKSLE